ncbi:MAG: hypothetical protein AB1716_11765 [Planctomycetota bacterium]
MHTRLILCGLVLGLTASSLGQPVIYEPGRPNTGQVNISGATLFRPFFEAAASTNDAIDADGDGFFGFDPNTFPYVDQLAASFTPGQPVTTIWAVQYRGVGSVNGLEEFVNAQLCELLNGSVPSELGLLNRFKWADGGRRQLGQWDDFLTVPAGTTYGRPPGDGDPNNDSGTVVLPEQVHVAILDVPSAWAVLAGHQAAALWHRGPTHDGYGQNPIRSNTGWDNRLERLDRDCGSGPVALNTNTGNPDESTIFDATVAWAVISYCANRGVARPDLNNDGVAGDMALSDLRHLMVSGRTISGENLAALTRSGGSGTRNGIMNTTGIDPSWGRGDNLADEWAISDNANLGPNRRLTNAEGSSGIERAMQVSRLGVGYTGLFGNERAVFDAAAGRYEILNVQFDQRGGTAYVRPSILASIKNCNPDTGYALGGQVTFVTRGDPEETNPARPSYMEERAPATYLRNILGSIALVANPDPNNPQFNMPGEYLATRFTLEAGVDCLPTFDNPSTFVPNAQLNQTLQDWMLANSVVQVPAYGSVNPAGLVPRRATPATDPTLDPNGFWLDGTPYTATYYRYKGAGGQVYTINRDAKLGTRNLVSGDFNRDALRSLADIPKLMEAAVAPLDFEQGQAPLAGEAGDQTGGNYVIVHLMGDFNGDGNFDAKDVRYFADGLALDTAFPNGKYGPLLNRQAAFSQVDTAWAGQPGGDGNYFDTVLATPKTYAAGDSAGDVAGSAAGAAAGADPRGADGRVDAADIDYVYRAFRNAYLGYDHMAVAWSNLDEAVYSDLSADLSGPESVGDAFDIVINQADVDRLVRVILGTNYGDANLDGQVNETDRQIVLAHLGQRGGWAEGNFDGDEFVDQDDLAWFGRRGDLNCDGRIDFNDINPFVLILSDPQGWQQQYPTCPFLNGDCNGDGRVDFGDISPFVALLSR